MLNLHSTQQAELIRTVIFQFTPALDPRVIIVLGVYGPLVFICIIAETKSRKGSELLINKMHVRRVELRVIILNAERHNVYRVVGIGNIRAGASIAILKAHFKIILLRKFGNEACRETSALWRLREVVVGLRRTVIRTEVQVEACILNGAVAH